MGHNSTRLTHSPRPPQRSGKGSASPSVSQMQHRRCAVQFLSFSWVLWEEIECSAAFHSQETLTHLGLIFISNVRLVKKKRGIEIKNWSFPNNWKWPEINYCFYIRVISQTLFFAFVFIDANSQQRYALKKTTHHVFPFILHPAVLINNNATRNQSFPEIIWTIQE